MSETDSVRSTCNLEQSLNNDGHPLGFNEAEAVAANGLPASNCSRTPTSDSGRSTNNRERNLDNGGHPLGFCGAEADVANGIPARNLPPRSGGEIESRYRGFGGRVISVDFEEHTRRIGIDGSPEEIRVAIKSAFGLHRSKGTFWLEDEDGVVQAIDERMPLKNYTLHVDRGLTTNICFSVEPNHSSCLPVEKTFYTEDDFSAYLQYRGWMAVKGSRCNSIVDSLDGLNSDELYHGLRLPSNNSN